MRVREIAWLLDAKRERELTWESNLLPLFCLKLSRAPSDSRTLSKSLNLLEVLIRIDIWKFKFWPKPSMTLRPALSKSLSSCQLSTPLVLRFSPGSGYRRQTSARVCTYMEYFVSSVTETRREESHRERARASYQTGTSQSLKLFGLFIWPFGHFSLLRILSKWGIV